MDGVLLVVVVVVLLLVVCVVGRGQVEARGETERWLRLMERWFRRLCYGLPLLLVLARSPGLALPFLFVLGLVKAGPVLCSQVCGE